jgi:hypothetical protein
VQHLPLLWSPPLSPPLSQCSCQVCAVCQARAGPLQAVHRSPLQAVHRSPLQAVHRAPLQGSAVTPSCSCARACWVAHPPSLLLPAVKLQLQLQRLWGPASQW